ncbi:hypothetical protein K4F85_01060 [Phaeobacter inhibens]|uniref:hypothetical protein n=1 Tax=Phaeobacter inhibens TaxID=221822 RepID=UPI0021A3C4DB|nr:hypothetical protein [Phaeobacter inhibens]UWR41526.1 hypothetical protein K4F85_01060 [Phaeobacter inhibens]
MGGMIGTMRGDRMLRSKRTVAHRGFGLKTGPTFQTGQISNLRGFAVSRDAKNAYVVDLLDDTVHRYVMSTPGDVSTMVYANDSLDVSPPFVDLTGVAISPNGDHIYVTDPNNGTRQYTMSTPHDLSTASFVGAIADDSTKDPKFSADGLKLWLLSTVSGGRIYQFNLSTPFLLSTAVSDGSLIVPNYPEFTDEVTGLHVSDDGSRALLMSPTVDMIWEAELVIPNDITSVVPTGYSLGISGYGNFEMFAHNDDLGRLWFIDNNAKIHQFDV